MNANIYANIQIAAIIVLFALNGTLLWVIFDFKKKWNAIFGKNAKNNSDTLQTLLSETAKLKTKLEVAEPKIDFLEGSAKIAVQKVGFKRYNPFSETGSDQSFTVCFLDRQNNGVVISSLYLREGVRVYGKQIESGKPKQPLSDEEKAILEETLKS